jgi:Icc-related predicted phosphoesterase
MKIATISDTHGYEGWLLPPCDVFIHAGDITANGDYLEAAGFAHALMERMDMGDVAAAILVPGNHDRCFQEDGPMTRALFDDPRIHLLIDQGVEIDGRRFWGSPWTPPYKDWFFMAEEDRLAEIYQDMPANLDVLITHGPPRGILDPGFAGDHVGSVALMDAIASRTIRHHVFGHLHAGGGKAQCGPSDTMHHNVAAVEGIPYKLVRGCEIIEIP